MGRPTRGQWARSTRILSPHRLSGGWADLRLRPRGTTSRQLAFGSAGGELPRWGPFGGQILYIRSSHELWLVRADGRHDHLLKAFNAHRFIADMAWAPGAGRIVLVMGPVDNGEDRNGTDLFVYTPRTNTLTRLHAEIPDNGVGNPDRSPSSVDWSHDGRRILFSATMFIEPFDQGPNDLFTIAPNGTSLRQLTHTEGLEGLSENVPRWSPTTPESCSPGPMRAEPMPPRLP